MFWPHRSHYSSHYSLIRSYFLIFICTILSVGLLFPEAYIFQIQVFLVDFHTFPLICFVFHLTKRKKAFYLLCSIFPQFSAWLEFAQVLTYFQKPCFPLIVEIPSNLGSFSNTFLSLPFSLQNLQLRNRSFCSCLDQ